MSRPSDLQVQLALNVLTGLADDALSADGRRALRTIKAALRPRPVWPAKEAAWCLGVKTSNLRTVKGLPAAVQEFDRPTTLHPDKKMKLWYIDLIEAHPKAVETAAKRRAEKEGGR